MPDQSQANQDSQLIPDVPADSAVNTPKDTTAASPATPPPAETGGLSWMQQVADKVDQDKSKPSESKSAEPDSAEKPAWMTTESAAPAETTETQSTSQPDTSSSPPPPPTDDQSAEEPAEAYPLKDSPFKKLIPFIIGLVVLGLIAFGVIKLIGMLDLGGNESTSKTTQSTSQPEAQEPITLTWWGLWEPKSVVSQVILDYQRSHPNVIVDYVQQDHKNYRERLQSALARDEGPDIFRFHNTWVPMLRKELSAMPTSIYSPAQFQEMFYSIMESDLKTGSSYVGLPLMYDGLALFYNQDMLNEIQAEVPTTWEQFRKIATQLTQWDEEGKITRSGAALGTSSNVSHFSDILGLMMLQNGANLGNPTNKVAEDALSFYTIFTQKDRVWDETMPVSDYAFSSGKAAMILAPSWRALEIKAANPDLNFGVAPVPQLPGTNISWASYWAEGVSSRSSHQTEAWQFLKYLTEKETLEKLYSAAAAERGFGEIYPRKDLADLLKDDPITGAYINQISQAQTWYMCSRTHDNGLNDRIIKYWQDAVNAVLDNGQSKQALETAAQGIQQVLSQYKISQ